MDMPLVLFDGTNRTTDFNEAWVNGSASNPAVTALFPHLAFGQGYTTVFTLFNIGSDAVVGNLILTGQDGSPLTANLSSNDGTTGTGSSIALYISAGGTKFVTASSVKSTDSIKAGWARVESSGGTLSGVATFQYAPNGSLLTIAGVLSSSPVSSATIPVYDDVDSGRFTGYAIANPGTSSITVNVMEVSGDGTSITNLSPISLGPGQQIAQFFFQDSLAKRSFKARRS